MTFKKSTSVFLFFIFAYFFMRLPVYPLKMQGEDGIFAALITQYNQRADQTMLGRVNGKELFCTVAHPGLSYALLKVAGYIPPFYKNLRSYPPFWLTTLSRFIFSLYCFFGFGLLVFFLLKQKKENWKKGILFLTATAALPVAVAGSVYLQIDNTTGALIVAVFSFVCLLIIDKRISKTVADLSLFLASIFIGFGKTEWSFVLIFAVLVSLVWNLILKQAYFKYALLIISGCVLGNFINYFYSPLALLQGFDAMSMAKSSEGFGYFLKLTFKRLLWVTPLLVLQAGLLFFILKQKKKIHFLTHVLLFLALGLMAGYSVSFALPHSRYFVPSLMATAALGLWAVLNITAKGWQKVLIIFYAVALVQTSFYILERIKKTQIDKFVDAKKWEDVKLAQNCVPLADAIYFVSPYDFIFAPTGRAPAQEYINQVGSKKTVCP